MEKTKLNIGSGIRPKNKKDNAWLDLDVREVVTLIDGKTYKPDVVADANNIPAKNNTYEKLLAHSVVEHFNKRDVADYLIEWHRVLQPNGKLVISVPDMARIALKLIKAIVENNNVELYQAINLTYGEQNYPENTHKWGWTEATLKKALLGIGFRDFKRLENKRYESELFIEVTKKVFYSQFGEDQWLVANEDLPEKGVFVDVGAGDPVRFSNSKYFEDNGWDVYCIDGDSRQVSLLKKQRKNVIHAVIANEEKEYLYRKHIQPDLSGIVSKKGDDTINVKAVTLDKVLKDYKVDKVDILSIDVEGHEESVLKSMSLKKHKPTIIIAEYATPSSPQDNGELAKMLKQYKIIKKTGANLIFKLKE